MRSRNRQDYDVHGEVHFVTSSVVGLVPIFEREDLRRIFADNLNFYRSRGDFVLLAWVLMPHHFHLIMKRIGERSLSEIVGNLKRMTARQIGQALESTGSAALIAELADAAQREPAPDSKIWQYRFDSLLITREETLRQKVEYIHNNPMNAGLVMESTRWLYSSARDYASIDSTFVPVDTGWTSIGYENLPSGKGS